MHIEIVTPDQKVFSGEVASATFPGSDGSFQVLDNHAALISTLGQGNIVLKAASQSDRVIGVDGGVVEVLRNRVTVLAEAVTA